MLQTKLSILKFLYNFLKFLSIIFLFLAFIMMIVWMSAISNHFLGWLEHLFSGLILFTKKIYNAEFHVFNVVWDFSYVFASLMFIFFNYLCHWLANVIVKIEEYILEENRKTKLKEEILMNKELEKDFKKTNLSENKFIVKFLLKETPEFKVITYEDSHNFFYNLLKLLKKQNINFDYRESQKVMTIMFNDFANIDDVVKTIKYWAKDLKKLDYYAVILLNKDNVQVHANAILNVISPNKIVADAILKAKYEYKEEKNYQLSSEGTFFINHVEKELFMFY